MGTFKVKDKCQEGRIWIWYEGTQTEIDQLKEWTLTNCKSAIRTNQASVVDWFPELQILQLFVFDNKDEALMFKLSNT